MLGVGVKRGNEDMGHEDGVDSGLDGGCEGRQFDRVEALAVVVDQRNGEVRVGIGVAVAGKVLGGGQHAVLVRAFDIGGGHPADERGVFAKGAGVDDGIVRVGGAGKVGD